MENNYYVSFFLKTTRSRQRKEEKQNKDSQSTEPSNSNTNLAMTSTEQCAICMEHFAEQEVGIPQNCEHTFCLACIIEWAKVKKNYKNKT